MLLSVSKVKFKDTQIFNERNERQKERAMVCSLR